MALVKIRYLQDYKERKAGEEANMNRKGAEAGVVAGMLEIIDDIKPNKKPKKVKKSKDELAVENLEKGNVILKIKKYEKAQKDKQLTEKAIELMKQDGKELVAITDLIPYIKPAEEALRQEKNKTKKQSFSGLLRIDNYAENVELFWKNQPFFYDKNQIFWWWNEFESKYERIDDTDLMNLIDEELGFGGQTVTGGLKNNYLEAFKRVGRKHLPKETSKHWIQFKNSIIDIKNKTSIDSSPEYFICNSIPQDVGISEETPVIDKLFCEWVGEEHKEILYEIIAYCCLPDYPIHTLFALIGSGRNGKSRYLELINRFVGRENITSTELDTLLDNRFESAKLYKKLVCSMGETNFGTLKKTSLIKKLTGGDLIGFEFKNKTPFDDYNYAKILISSNSLPTSDDTSEGFYRRWIIIKFPNDFPEGKDILETIPAQEYSNLSRKIIKKLYELLERGSFTNQGSIEERKKKYVAASNPLKIFIEDHCIVQENSFMKYNELYNYYIKYLIINKQRVVTKREFSNVLNLEGFIIEKTSKNIDGEYINGFWVFGLTLKKESSVEQNLSTDVTHVTDVTHSSLSFPIREKEVEHLSQLSQQSHTSEENALSSVKSDNILLPCSVCGAPPPCGFIDAKGRPLCEFCGNSFAVNKGSVEFIDINAETFK